VVVGFTGLLDLGYVAFYAVGAYSYCHSKCWDRSTVWNWNTRCGTLAASAGIILGFPTIRARGDYLSSRDSGFWRSNFGFF